MFLGPGERQIEFLTPIFSPMVHGGPEKNRVCFNDLYYLRGSSSGLSLPDVTISSMLHDVINVVLMDPTKHLISKRNPVTGRYFAMICGPQQTKDLFFYEPSRRAAIALMVINKFDKHSVIGWLPKDVAKIIARMICSSNFEPEWNGIGKQLYWEKAKLETSKLFVNSKK